MYIHILYYYILKKSGFINHVPTRMHLEVEWTIGDKTSPQLLSGARSWLCGRYFQGKTATDTTYQNEVAW